MSTSVPTPVTASRTIGRSSLISGASSEPSRPASVVTRMKLRTCALYALAPTPPIATDGGSITATRVVTFASDSKLMLSPASTACCEVATPIDV
ncbi:hypothetical protein D3C86_2026440 [compost metagenome]